MVFIRLRWPVIGVFTGRNSSSSIDVNKKLKTIGRVLDNNPPYFYFTMIKSKNKLSIDHRYGEEKHERA